MKKEINVKELKELAKNAQTIDDLYAITFQLLESDMSDNEICSIINSIHLTEEVKQIIKQEIGEEKEEILRK